MQQLGWYAHRLRAMTPQEILWRFRAVLRGPADRWMVGRRARPRPVGAITTNGRHAPQPGFHVSDLEVGAWASTTGVERSWCDALRARADRILSGHLRFFDLGDCDLGNPPDWNRDHKHDRAAPRDFSPAIDYRDFDVTGDCKYVWEPNRHHQFVTLGQAYRASGERRYAEGLVAQLASWLDQCPYGSGMNWRSPLELGIRLINWVWALDLIRPSGVVGGAFAERLLNAVYRHVWDIQRNYSRGSSANNHLIGEAVGVYVAAAYFRQLRNASRWRAQARRILCETILSQTYAEGGTREQALGYHLFVLQFYLVAARVAELTGEMLPTSYGTRLEAMFDFLGALCAGGERPPMFGDADDGMVLDLEGAALDARTWLTVGATLFQRPDLTGEDAPGAATVRWLLGSTPAVRPAKPTTPVGDRLTSRAFPETGLYLLQSGRRGSPDRISVVFDCGPLGMSPLYAHGHADALSFTLRAFGVDVLVDPGTYDYFTYPEWRTYFRSTRAHNAIELDQRDQSTMRGLFLWGDHATARCIEWAPAEQGGRVIGEHDGYARGPNPVVHRRALELDAVARRLTIRDELQAQGEHDVALYLHLAEGCRVIAETSHRMVLDVGAGAARLELDPALSIRMLAGSVDPIGGWVSRGYHRRTATTTLVGQCHARGTLELTTRIDIGLPAGDVRDQVGVS